MASRMFRVFLCDSEDREVVIEATYSPPTQDYFSKSFGNFLPGDPEEIEVLSVKAMDEGADVAEVEAMTDAIEEAVRLSADDAAEDYEEIDR